MRMHVWLAAAILFTVSSAACAASIQVSAQAPLAGNFSLLADASGPGPAYVLQNGLSLTEFAVEFSADIDDFAAQAPAYLPVLALFGDVAGTGPLQIRLQQDSVLFSDGLESRYVNAYAELLTAGTHRYRLQVNLATGLIQLLIDGNLMVSLTHDFAPSTLINRVRFGVTQSLVSAGTIRLDDFVISIPGQPLPTFMDDFESGNTANWSATVP